MLITAAAVTPLAAAVMPLVAAVTPFVAAVTLFAASNGDCFLADGGPLITPQRVWKGDIRAFNSISHEDYEDTNVIVHSDGRIFWIPPITFHTSCDFGSVCYDLKSFNLSFQILEWLQ